jgi:hypothetical protein
MQRFVPAAHTHPSDPLRSVDERHSPARLVAVAENKKELRRVDFLLWILDFAEDEAKVV